MLKINLSFHFLVGKAAVKRKLPRGADKGGKLARASSGEFEEEGLNGISYSPLMDEEGGSSDIERMIKNGEMTPFGTVVDFEQKSTGQKQGVVLSGEKRVPSGGERMSAGLAKGSTGHNLNQANDFDSFLSAFDAKQKKPAAKKTETVTIFWKL